jgi:hypothetical protein
MEVAWMDAPQHDHVAILAPGPSVTNFPGRDGFDAIVGINRAVEFTSCDYWFCVDRYGYHHFTPLGQPVTIAWNSIVVPQVRARPAIDFRRRMCGRWGKDDDIFRMIAGSALAGIVVVTALFRPSSITTFGQTWSGSEDWDGVDRDRRPETRWEKERARFNEMQAALERRGVALVRK